MQSMCKLLLSTVLFCASALGHATTITFEDSVRAGNDFTAGGYSFSSTGPLFLGPQQVCMPSCPNNGTTTVLLPFSPSSLTMFLANGGTFSLSGFDGAGSFGYTGSLVNRIPDFIDVVGTLANNTTVSQSFALNPVVVSGMLPFTSYAFNNTFTNLKSVKFSASGSDNSGLNGFSIDNIATGNVPEPGSIALVLLALGAAGLVARAKRPPAA